MKHTLNDLCNFEKGKTGIQKAIPGEYPLVVTGSERKSSSDYQFDCEAVCVPLVSSTGHGHKSINYIHYQSGKFALGTILVALIPKDRELLSAEYLREYLLAYKEEKIVSLMKGGANVTLPIKALMNLSVEVPSIKKQREIVDKVKKVRHLITQTNENYDLTQDKLAALKSSLISEAIRGKLVPQDPKDESAEKLLEKIKLRQKQWIKSEKLINNREASTIENKLTKISKLIPSFPDETIPSSWVWSRLIETCCAVVDCHNKTAPYTNQGIPLVRTTDIKNGRLNLTSVKYVGEDTYKYWSRRLPPAPGDLLFTREAPVGEAAIIPENVTLCMGQRMLLIRPFNEYLDNKYLLYVLSDKNFLKRISKKQIGNTVKHLRVGDVENVYIPLPPLEEQKRIVERVDMLMQVCEKQKKNIIDAKDKLEQLHQAILREMFE